MLAEAGPRLVVLDPILAFLEGGGNSDHTVRRALTPLACLAERRRCVILLVLHLNKTDGPAPCIAAACRFAWQVGLAAGGGHFWTAALSTPLLFLVLGTAQPKKTNSGVESAAVQNVPFFGDI